MLKIIQEDKKKENISKIKEICDNMGLPVFILGGGTYGRIVANYLKNMGISAPILFTEDDGFVSEERRKEGIIPFSEYSSRYGSMAPLVFGIYDYRIVLRIKKEYKNIISNMFDFHFAVVNGERVDWNKEYVMDNFKLFEHTYNLLSSDKSKEIMNAYLNAAVAGEFHELYEKYVDTVPYFNDKIKHKKIAKLFDCGAFDGDSAHDFANVFCDYECIYEFEPDLANIKKIQNRIINENIRDIVIINKGVWSETTTLSFVSEGKSSSNISECGDSSINVIKLDDMYDCFSANSLIKMDIEGSELEALKGASKVISQISPSLAICVYHKREDLITIPQYIESLVTPGTYNYYIGYQGVDLAELVYYAVRTQ